MTVTGPLLPLIAAEFGRTVGEAGVIVIAFAVPYGCCQILFGPLGDRYGKLKVVAVSLAVGTLFVAGCGLSDSLPTLAAMRFACGVAMAATIPLAMAWIADEVPAEIRQPVIGRYTNGLVLGQIAGGLLGGVAAEYFDWRQVFFFLALACGLVALLLWRQARPADSGRAVVRRRWEDVLRLYYGLFAARQPREIIIAGTLEGFLIFGVLAYLGAYLRHELTLDYARIGVVLSGYGMGGMVFAAAVYRIVRVLGERRMVRVGSSLLGAAFIAFVLTRLWWLNMMILFCAGFGFYLLHNTMQMQATELSSEARGTAVALWVFMLFFGQGVGVFAFGLVIDAFGYLPAFACSGLSLVLMGRWFSSRMVTHSVR